MSRILDYIIRNNANKCFYIQIRHLRQRPLPIVRHNVVPELYYSMKERLQEKDEKLQDPETHAPVDIGYSLPKSTSSSTIEKLKYIQKIRNSVDLEKQARKGTLELELDVVENEWIHSLKPKALKLIAENYDIYKHLFGDYAYFYPVIHMDIFYDYDEQTISPVHYGNLLKPKEAASPPKVQFESNSDSFWTLILTNPDGNLLDNDSEMIHWFVANIPGGDVTKGEEIIDYMQPIPPKGSGFHRLCFVLYKQNEKLNFFEFCKDKPCLRLADRSFKTFDFYKKFQDVLTPAGLSWFQADYDLTLRDYFHHTLKMKEPIYEYEFPKPYIRPQRLYPHLQAFNRYLDLHRDPKETQKLMLIKRLKKVHPFGGEKPLLPFPLAEPVPREWAHWQKNELEKEREGKGKYRDMYRGDDRPYIYVGRSTRSYLYNNLK